MLGNYIQKRGEESGYEVRLVNTINAYDWLSNQTADEITYAMANRKLEVGPDELLRFGLLMEHGGVLAKVDEVLLIENLGWLDQHFSQVEETKRP